MSSVDNRIVQMEFDNKQFESGVKETMSTLDRLKQALKLDNVSDGFDKLGKSSDDLSKNMKRAGDDSASAFSVLSSQLDSISGKVDSLVSRFSVLGEMIHNFGVQFASTVKEMSIGQVSAGFTKYAESTEAISTLKSALGVGSKDAIYKAVQELNTYSDQTSYDLSSMTQNLSMFVNSGVKLDVATKAIKGIGNAAANAGVSIQKTKNVMKNFSDALGAGAMKLQDWKSLELMGFATKEIKEQFIEAGKKLKKIDKNGFVLNDKGKKTKVQITYENFRESLRYNWLTADVMMKTLQAYEDVETELGASAFEAAKVARTYQEAMDAVKDAVSTGWMHVFENIFGDVDEAAKLWTSFSDLLIVRLSDPFFGWINGILADWKKFGGREKLIRMFSEMSAMLIGLETEIGGTVYVNQNLLSTMVEAIQEVFGELDWRKLLIGTDKIMMAMVNLHKWMDSKNAKGETVFDRIKGGLIGVFSVFSIFGEIGKGIWTFGTSIAGQLVPSLETLLDLLPEVGAFFKSIADWFKDNKIFQKLGERLANIFTPFTSRLPKLINKVYEGLKGFVTFLGTNETVQKAAASWKTFFVTFLDGIPKFIEKGFAFAKSLYEVFKTTDEFKKMSDIYTKYVKPIGKGLVEFGGKVADSLTNFFTFDTSAGTNAWEKLKLRFGAFGELGTWVTEKWGKLKELIPSLGKVEKFWNDTKIPEKMSKAFDLVDNVFSAMFGLDTSAITSFAGKIKARLKAGYDVVKPAVEKFYKKLKDYIKNHDFLNAMFSTAKKVGSKVKTFLSPVTDKVTEWYGKFKEKLKAISESDDPFGAFIEAVQNFGTKIKTKFQTFIQPAVDLFDKFKAKVKEIFASDNPLEKAGELISSVGEKIKNAVHKLIFGEEGQEKENFLTKAITAITTSWDKAKEKLTNAWDKFSGWIGPYWESAKEFISKLFSGEGEGAEADGQITFIEKVAEKVSSAWESFKAKVVPVLEEIHNFFKKLLGADTSAYGENASITDVVTGVFEESVESGELEKTMGVFDKVKEFFENIKKRAQELWESIKSLDWASLYAKVKTTMFLIGGIVIAATGYNIAKTLKLNAKSKLDSLGTTFLKIAGSIAMVAAAFYFIGTLNENQIKNAKTVMYTLIGVVTGIVALVTALSFAFGGTGKGVKNIASAFLSIAGSIALIGAAIYILGALYGDGSVFEKGVEIVIAITGFIILVQIAMAIINERIGQPARMEGLISFAASILLLGLAVIALGYLDSGKIWMGVLVVTALAVVIAGFQALMALVGKFIGQPASLAAPIAVAVAVLLLGLAVIALGLLPVDGLWRGLAAVVVLTLCIAGLEAMLAYMSKSHVSASAVLTMIVTAVLLGALMIALAYAFNKVKDIPTDTMLVFAGSLMAIVVTMSIAMAVLSAIPFPAAISAAVSLFIFFVALALAFTVASAIASVGVGDINTMIFTLGSTLGTFSDLTADGSAENAKQMAKDIAGMIGDIVAVAAHAGEIEQYKLALSRIGNGLKIFNTSTAALNPSRAENALTMANKIGEVVTALKDSGVENFPDMSLGLTYLGSALSLYASSISNIEIPEDAKFDPQGLKDALGGIAEALPGDDMLGAFRDIASTEEGSKGDELAKFALGMEAIKNALWDYATICTDLPITEVTAANTALSELAGLTTAIPATSISLDFLGFNATIKTNKPTLEEFAGNVTDLSTGLANFAEAAEGIDVTKVETAVTTLTKISEIKPPSKGGIFDFLTGKGTLASFATQMGYLADGFAKYAEKAGAEGINYDNIKNSRTVIEELAAIQNSLDPAGGLMGIIGGDEVKAFAGLATNMGNLGAGVAAFCKAISDKGLEFTNTESAIGVIRDLGSIQSSLKETGGLAAIFDGEVKLGQFAEEFPKLGTAIASFNEGLGTAEFDDTKIRNVLHYLSSFTMFAVRLNNIPIGVSNLESLGTGITAAVGNLVTANNSLSGLTGGDFSGKFDKALESLKAFKDVAIELQGIKVDGKLGNFTQFGEDISKFYKTLMDLSTDYGLLGSSFNMDKLKGLTDGIKAPFEAIKEALESIKGIDSGELSFSSIISTMLDNGVEAVEGKEDSFKTAAGALVRGLQNGVSDGSIDEQAAGLGSKGAAALQSGDIYSQFVAAGKHLVAGLAEGLSSYGPAVSAAETMAAKVLQAMRNKMAIQSPSKITTEYGMYLDEGLADGIEKYGQMANTAAGNIARMILGTMDAIIQNHDSKVPITPVLDTTNMANYANTFAKYKSEWISGELQRKLMSAKVADVASTMDVSVNDRYANTMESFRSDISDLGDRISSLRVVMDSGTVVGELAPGMDMALGRRANYSARRIS